MALIKRNGQLFEQDDSLMNRVNQLGTTTPTSPSGAAGIGASPDSAKMVGSGAQRQNALRQAVAPKEQTLAGQQRLAGPAEATTADQQAQQKAEQIRQLGSMNTRVQGLLENRIAQSSQGLALGEMQADDARIMQALGLNEQLVASDPTQFNQVKGLVESYMNTVTNPVDMATELGIATVDDAGNALSTEELTKRVQEQILVNLVNAGMKKSDVYQLTGMTEDGAVVTGDVIAAAMADEMLVDDLIDQNIDQLGFASAADLAAAMGVSEQDLRNMTIQDFTQAAEQVQQQEYTELEKIRAELAGLPQGSARAKQLKAQMRALGDVGRTGMEASVARSLDELEQAGTVQIGGQEYDINELLDDDNFGDLIEQYIMADDKMKDEMFPPEEFGAFREWIENNQKAVANVVADAQGRLNQFEEVNKEYESMGAQTGLSDELLDTLGGGYDINKAITSNGLQSFKDSLSKTGVGSMALSGEYPTIIAEINNLDPQEMDELGILEWDQDKILQSHATMATINDPNSVMSGLFPDMADPAKRFASEDQMSRLSTDEIQSAVTALESMNVTSRETLFRNNRTREMISTGDIDPSIINDANANALADNEILDLIESGEISAEEANTLLPNYDDIKDEYKNAEKREQKIDELYDTSIQEGTPAYDSMVDSMLDTLFGEADWVDNLKGQLPAIEWAGKQGLIDQAQVDRYKELLSADSLSKLSDVDLKTFLQNGPTYSIPKEWNTFLFDTNFSSKLAGFEADKQWIADNSVNGNVSYKELIKDSRMVEKFYGENATLDPQKYGLPSPTHFKLKQIQDSMDYADINNIMPQMKKANFKITKKNAENFMSPTVLSDWYKTARADLTQKMQNMPKSMRETALKTLEDRYTTRKKELEYHQKAWKDLHAAPVQAALGRIKARQDKLEKLYKNPMINTGKYATRPTKTEWVKNQYGMMVKKEVPIPFNQLTEKQKIELAKRWDIGDIDREGYLKKQKIPKEYR